MDVRHLGQEGGEVTLCAVDHLGRRLIAVPQGADIRNTDDLDSVRSHGRAIGQGGEGIARAVGSWPGRSRAGTRL